VGKCRGLIIWKEGTPKEYQFKYYQKGQGRERWGGVAVGIDEVFLGEVGEKKGYLKWGV